ncbi:hypothetical protein ElyMa_003518000 [Elysia marginata]|uniref:Uncharacterized protein n=1 Tax=Elysia marginata TaxID=1093978 RepID=A0AAV4EHA2_9GAST|nr:hypothetical protein ElyMa_003518000 [Elysia marginata]
MDKLYRTTIETLSVFLWLSFCLGRLVTHLSLTSQSPPNSGINPQGREVYQNPLHPAAPKPRTNPLLSSPRPCQGRVKPQPVSVTVNLDWHLTPVMSVAVGSGVIMELRALGYN